MKLDQFNILLKDNINELINQGYKESDICDILLSRAYLPRFHSYLKDDESLLGMKPLSKICDSLGYDFLIIPIKSDNDSRKEEIYKECSEFVHIFKDTLNKYLSTKEPVERKKRGPSENGIQVKNTINSTITDLLEDLMEE